MFPCAKSLPVFAPTVTTTSAAAIRLWTGFVDVQRPAVDGCTVQRSNSFFTLTIKSTEDGLNQPFNTLEAQREAAEAYILSQRHAGWTVVAERYDDGGYQGRNLG